MKAKKKLAVLFTAALLALSLGVFAACAEEEHSLSYVGEVAATCTDAGHEAYYLCSHCGKLFADENAETELSDADVTIAALGHDMTHHEAVEATCTVNGNIEYWSCSRCNLNFSDEAGTKEVASVTLPAGHDIEWVDAVEPTTSSAGMRAHYECSKCHTCYEDIDGKEEIDREKLVLEQLVEQSVTVTVEVYDTAGNKVESPDFTAISGELSLLGAYSANQYEGLTVENNGTLELTSAIVGDYTVELYGYSRSTFTVTQGTSVYTLDLHATIAYGSNDKVTVDDKNGTITIAAQNMNANAWTGSAELVLPEGLGADPFVLDMTLKMGDFIDGWNTEATQQRYAVQLTVQNAGFYFWSWTAEASKTRVRQFAANNLANAMAENADVNDDESGNGYITDALRSDSGLKLRILRLADAFVLFAEKAGAWNEVGRISASPDAAAKIVFYGVQASYTWSGIGVTKLEYVPEVAATPEKPGNYAYYTDGTNYWFEDGEQTTEDGVMLYRPVDVTLTVNGIALDGETSEAVAAGTVITFTSRAATYTYTVGEEAPAEMVAGDYTVTADGYRTTEINVSTSGGAVNVTLIKVISIEGDVADYTGTRWSDSVALDISEELKASTAVILEFNVRNVTNSQASTGSHEWASQRIAIQMAQGYEGFLFFLPKGEANIFDLTDGGIRDEGKTRVGESGSALSWIDTLMRGASGVNMRIVRTGENVTLFVQNAEEEWVKIGTVACGSAATEIVFYGCGVEWEFSSVTAEEITYVPDKEPVSADEPGNIEYYTDGTNYWLPDGTATTLEETVVKYAAPVTLKLTGVALDGKTQEELDGTVLTFTSNKGSFTYTVGETEDFKLLPDTYTVTAEGYRNVQVTVPEEGGELELTLTKVITIGKGAVELTGNAWNGQQTIAVPDTITGDFLFEVTLKMSDFTTGAGELGAWQRYAIRLTEGSTGFYFWSWDNGGYKTFIRQFGANNLNDAKAENDPVNGDEANNGYILNELLDADGLQLRILRAGNTFYLYALNGDAWVLLGSVTCSEGDKIDMEVYAGVGTYEWSNVNFTKVTYVSEKAPVSADEPGNIEYYTDGTNYWLPDGTVTTREETVVKYEVEVTLTLEGVALDGETSEDVAEGTVITFTSARSVYTYTVGQADALRLSPDTYTVTSNGYKTASLTVTEGATEYTLTLYRTIAHASNDKVTVDNKNGTINIKGDVADYTGNQWSGSAELALSDEVKQSTNVTLEFTVRNVTNSQSGWPENEWASQRIAIQMAQGYEGFLFFLPSTETNIFDMTDNGIGDGDKHKFDANGNWINELMRSESGVNMRIVREGANVTLLVQNAEDAWVEIGTVTCASADAATEIVFYGCGVEWEFSSITVTPNVQE